MYRPRILDQLLDDRLRSAGAVLIEGPKASGKTATARRIARSEVLLDVDRGARLALDVDPDIVLAGATPRLIDEWQLSADIVWNAVRRTVDERTQSGQFILTGSSAPYDDARRHSGAGRFSVLKMRPMTLFEVNPAASGISLAALFRGEHASCPDPGWTIRDLAEHAVRGGWPGNLELSADVARRSNVDYLTQICEVDVRNLGAARRDPRRVRRLVTALARHTSTEAGRVTLAADTAGDDGDRNLALTTIDEYLDTLARLSVTEDLPAWSTHLRSRATLRQAPKRHFVDPSLAVAALGGTSDRLLADLEYLGLLFQSMVVRDLRVLSQPIDGTLYHYRDNTGLEIDSIVELPTGEWIAVEVKLGASQIDTAARHLLTLRERVDSSRRPAPSALVVVTGHGYGYVRDDGVIVAPIGALTP